MSKKPITGAKKRAAAVLWAVAGISAGLLAGYQTALRLFRGEWTAPKLVLFVLFAFTALFISINIHELGHFAPGAIFGYKLLSYRVGFINIDMSGGGPKPEIRKNNGYSAMCAMLPAASDLAGAYHRPAAQATANTSAANTSAANTPAANTPMANTPMANTSAANTSAANTPAANTPMANPQAEIPAGAVGRLLIFYSGGVLLNFITGTMFLLFALLIPQGGPPELARMFLRVNGAAAFFYGALNLLPIFAGGAPTDGKILIGLLLKRAYAVRLIEIYAMNIRLKSGLRPSEIGVASRGGAFGTGDIMPGGAADITTFLRNTNQPRTSVTAEPQHAGAQSDTAESQHAGAQSDTGESQRAGAQSGTAESQHAGAQSDTAESQYADAQSDTIQQPQGATPNQAPNPIAEHTSPPHIVQIRDKADETNPANSAATAGTDTAQPQAVKPAAVRTSRAERLVSCVYSLYEYYTALDSGEGEEVLKLCDVLEKNIAVFPAHARHAPLYEICYNACLARDVPKALKYYDRCGEMLRVDRGVTAFRVKAFYEYYINANAALALAYCDEGLRVKDKSPLGGIGVMEAELLWALRTQMEAENSLNIYEKPS